MRRALLGAAACAALLVPAAAQAAGKFDSTAYRKKVTVANMMSHEQELQAIADANNGTRAAGTSGNEATTDYVLHTMQAAGWQTHKQVFDFPFYRETGPATFEETSPTPTLYTEHTDYELMTYSGAGDKTGTVQPVDVTVPMDPNSDPSTSNSGCDSADWAGFVPGNIALVQRGTCTFGAKAQNAENAGAAAIVVFNEGQPGRQDVIAGTLGAPVGIPAIGVSYQFGADTVQRIRDNGQTVVWHILTQTESEIRQTSNVVADSPWGDQSKTVVVSAHNDSVAAGPGINDDGSGTAMDLELARQLGKGGLKPRNHVRFLWVGAEELGLLGSNYYVAHLSSAEKSQIIAMLDFDMVASPNWARQVYDGDGSTFGDDVSGPDGSGYIESLFNGWFDSKGQAHEPIPFDGRSDYVAFTNAGIPAGGVFTGAEKLKTAEEQAMFGGVEGVALDHCYHQACDDINNLDTTVFGQMKDAAADVLYQLMLTQNPIVDGSSPKNAVRLAHTFKGEQARK